MQNINLNWSFDISDAVDTANEKGEWKERQKRHQKGPGRMIFYDSGFKRQSTIVFCKTKYVWDYWRHLLAEIAAGWSPKYK